MATISSSLPSLNTYSYCIIPPRFINAANCLFEQTEFFAFVLSTVLAASIFLPLLSSVFWNAWLEYFILAVMMTLVLSVFTSVRYKSSLFLIGRSFCTSSANFFAKMHISCFVRLGVHLSLTADAQKGNAANTMYVNSLFIVINPD